MYYSVGQQQQQQQAAQVVDWNTAQQMSRSSHSRISPCGKGFTNNQLYHTCWHIWLTLKKEHVS
jgi:hypothetical protein